MEQGWRANPFPEGCRALLLPRHRMRTLHIADQQLVDRAELLQAAPIHASSAWLEEVVGPSPMHYALVPRAIYTSHIVEQRQ